jgi:hypothetical protein
MEVIISMPTSTKAIKVSLENYDRLARLGTLDDSLDSVIGRLLSTYYHHQQIQQPEKMMQEQAQES